MTSDGQACVPAPTPVTRPRLLVFSQDERNESRDLIGWRTIARGLVLEDGTTISVAVERPVLGIYEPHCTFDHKHDVQPLPRPSTGHAPPLDGAADPGTCPKPIAGGQDRSPGIALDGCERVPSEASKDATEEP